MRSIRFIKYYTFNSNEQISENVENRTFQRV